MRTLVLSLLILLAATVPIARACPAPSDEALPGSRIIRTFDFEEQKLGNYESLPMFWSKVGGTGYPAYSAGAFDHAIYRSATTSFKLDTQGGSVAYRFTPPPDKRIEIQPNADYYVLAFVRSSGLKHARADMVAWYADEKGDLILPTETHSEPYKPSEATGTSGDAWQVLYIYLPGPGAPGGGAAASAARSLVLQVGLLQPQQLGEIGAGSGDAGLGPFALYQQDIKGSIWIDDITVFQLPRVGITPTKKDSASAGGIFGSTDKVAFDIQLSTLTGRENAAQLKARVRITDSDGLMYGQEEFTPSASSGWAHHIEHAPLPAGMYTATLEVMDVAGGSGGTLVARRQTRFLCLPASQGPAGAAHEFGLGAAAYSASADWSELPFLLRQSGAGLVQIPAWRKEMTEEAILRRDPALDGLLAALQRQNVRVIGAFSQLPTSVAARITPAAPGERNSILSLLNADEQLWRPYISMLVTRYANRVDWWELGSPDAPIYGTATNSLPAIPGSSAADRAARLYEKAHGEMRTLMRRPEMIVPWSALKDFDDTRYPQAIPDLRLPPVIKPSQIPAYIDNFRGAAVTDATMPAGAPASGPAGGDPSITPRSGGSRPVIAHLDGLDPRETARADRIADFAERIVYAKSANPEAILFDITPQKPDELLLVYGTMARALGGSTFLSELSLAPGIKAFLFKKGNNLGRGLPGATLVLWSDAAGAPPTQLDLPLGAAGTVPQESDLLGNQTALKIDPSTRLSRVFVSAAPIVIEDIDPKVLLLISSYALATPILPAGAGSIRTEVLLQNPYAESITGSLRLLLPKGWSSDPPSFPVALPAGGSLRQSIILAYPFAENAGPKRLAGRLDLDPGNSTGLAKLDLACQVAIGSDQIEMEGFASRGEGGEIVLQQVITNISGGALDGQAYALMPGYQWQRRYIVGLQPGQTTIKRYIFNPADFVAGATGTDAVKGATLGVKQNDGRTLMTRLIPLQ